MSVETEIQEMIKYHIESSFSLTDSSDLETLIDDRAESAINEMETGFILDMVTDECSTAVRELQDDYELLTHEQYETIQSRLAALEPPAPVEDILSQLAADFPKNQIDWVMPPNSIFAGYSDFDRLEEYIRAAGATNPPMIVAMAMATARNLIEEKLQEQA